MLNVDAGGGGVFGSSRVETILADVASVDWQFTAIVVSLLFALVATPLVIVLLRRVNVMDHPNERSSHAHSTVRGAGWSVLFGTLAGWFSANFDGPSLWWLPASAVLYGLVGFADDLRTLPWSVRFALQIVAASGAIVVAEASEVVDLPLLLLPVAVFVVVAYVNAFNFMDGVNGISGIQAAVVGVLLAIAGTDAGSMDVQIGGLAIAGAGLGFLPFNAVRAKCFLGDVGSYFIGAWIALLCVVAYDRSVSAVTIASFMAVYAADTGFTLIQRVRRGDKWWTPHREHVYQRLSRGGFGHLATGLVVGTFTVLAGAIGISLGSIGSGLPSTLASAMICLLYLRMPSAREARDDRDAKHPE